MAPAPGSVSPRPPRARNVSSASRRNPARGRSSNVRRDKCRSVYPSHSVTRPKGVHPVSHTGRAAAHPGTFWPAKCDMLRRVTLRDEAKSIAGWIVDLRRQLHRHPELMYEEIETKRHSRSARRCMSPWRSNRSRSEHRSTLRPTRASVWSPRTPPRWKARRGLEIRAFLPPGYYPGFLCRIGARVDTFGA